MSWIVDLISRPETLTVTNVVLAFCIVFHLCCEFAHYIHEFWSHRKDGKELKQNGQALKELKELVERMEKVQSERKEHKCQCSKNEKEEVLP